MPDGLHPDRLLPADPAARDVARGLLGEVTGLPIVSVHGHLDAGALRRDEPLADPATVLVSDDHYVLRHLHGVGHDLADLGRGAGGAPPAEVWQRLCDSWPALAGTPSGLWLAHALVDVLGVPVPPRPEHFDDLRRRLAALTPLGVLGRAGVALLSTTDAPATSFEHHLALQAAGHRVVPTVRPDALTDATRPGWAAAVEAAGLGSCAALLAAVADARRASVQAGAVATDHGHATPHTEVLDEVTAEVLFDRAAGGRADDADRARLAGHLLTQMAVMSLDDGLVLQLHSGVARDHDAATAAAHGADVGADFPVPVTFTEPLRALLGRCGGEPGFRMVVFTLDETTWSRELGPMASWYPGLFLGAPWWFLDAPGALGRFFDATLETAGWRKLSGFVDDTRAILSIAARHDAARRVLAGRLATAVAEHRIAADDASRIARWWAHDAAVEVYRCG